MNSLIRMSALPEIFTATDAIQIGKVESSQLNQVMWRWKNSGLVKPLGARCDVWFNLVKDPVITQDRWIKAVRLAVPHAILAGHQVLQRSGLTTQIAGCAYLIRAARSAACTIDGAELHERPAAWIKRLWEIGAISSNGGLAELDPGAALADLLAFAPNSIDLDDIYFDEVTPESLAFYEELTGNRVSEDHAGILKSWPR